MATAAAVDPQRLKTRQSNILNKSKCGTEVSEHLLRTVTIQRITGKDCQVWICSVEDGLIAAAEVITGRCCAYSNMRDRISSVLKRVER